MMAEREQTPTRTSHTIRNPIEWGWKQLGLASGAVEAAGRAVRGSASDAAAHPGIRRIGTADIRDALAKGAGDLAACRTDIIVLCLVYPVIGLLLARLVVGYDLLPLVFPLASGFALLGPAAAMGLYELSRRRELGQGVSWLDAFAVVRSPRFGSILVLTLMLLVIFLGWLAAAWGIYAATLGPAPPASVGAFLDAVFSTGAGWAMIVVGVGVGFVFAVVVLVTSVVSFPALLDRDLGVIGAVALSVRAVRANPGPFAVWGVIVAGGLVLGSLPALLGLVVVVPVLGHATWHLYRKVIA